MDKYKVIRVLNSGSFGTAILVSEHSSGVSYVIKDIDISKLSRKEREATFQEVRILEALRHPNIVAFKEAFTQDGSLKIVMQYCDGGDLLGFVKSQGCKLLNENYILDIFVQLALAIKHVHDRKIIHRDIKTENIFLSSHKRVVKLGDFGIAKVLENTLQQARTSIGTPYYLSPEICQGKVYNFKSDIWSLGVVLYELCALRCPFAGANMKGLMLCISKGSYSPVSPLYSSDLRKLISDMLNLNAKMRPSINELLQRPILQQRISKLIEGSIFRQEFSHTVLHGQHYSKMKCLNPSSFPASTEPADSVLPRPAEPHKQEDAVPKRVGFFGGNQAIHIKVRNRAASNVKEPLKSKPKECHRVALERVVCCGDLISAKCDRDQEAIIAERIDCERRDRDLEFQKEFNQKRLEKQAEAIDAACFDRIHEDRAKQKKQQILALEMFRQKQAKQWLGGIVQSDSHTAHPSGQCSVRSESQDPDLVAAKLLRTVKSPVLNSVDEVKARGAALKIEEQRKYEHALAIARKQAFLERLAAEDRRQRELLSAVEVTELVCDKRVANQFPQIADIECAFPSLILPPQCTPSVAHGSLNEPSNNSNEILNVSATCSNSSAVCGSESMNGNLSKVIHDHFTALNPQLSELDMQEEQSLCDIVGELMHLTLDPSSNIIAEDVDCDNSSVFEKIEELRQELESHLGTQNFIDLYELAKVCRDGSSKELESKIDAFCSHDSDSIFNSLVQLLTFESEVYNS